MRVQFGRLLFVLVCTGVFAQDRPLRFEGEATLGKSFRKEIGRGLVFVLRPADDGWTVVVEPAGGLEATGCRDNFAGVIGVPLRGYREVDLAPGYGNTAREAVALSPREIDFVLTGDDCRREDERRTKLSWPSSYTQKEVEEAQAKFATSPAGTAVVKVLDSKTSPSGAPVEGKDYGKIDWLRFEVVVTFPRKCNHVLS